MLFEHLLLLRSSDEPTHPRHDRSWRAIASWLAMAYAERGPGADDARQETLVTLFRSVSGMRAESPAQAASWLLTIVRRKHVDALRAAQRDPVTLALRAEPRTPDVPSPLERLPAEALERLPAEDGAGQLAQVVATVLEHVHAHLEETVKNPSKRLLRATQARATMLRLVYEEDADAIAEALDHGEPIPRNRIYKWIERGRPTVLAALERWEQNLDGQDDPAGAVIGVFRELVEARRADAGVPRPNRRRKEPG